MSRLGIVAIGRNEGQRLHRCLESVVHRGHVVVYVDSGSTDGSVELARSLGAEVVELDLSVPFTAARARNEGFARLEQLVPGVELVQFVDGDCEVAPGWLDRATAAFDEWPDVAVVTGRRRERYPERTIYNRLADFEWDGPAGEVEACGGDAMFRASVLREAGGYDPSLIAGEEPELCLRIRRRGWKVVRLAAEMTAHDVDMTRFLQWWRRSVRAGYAHAEGAARYGHGPERFNMRQIRSILFWGIGLPAVVVVLAFCPFPAPVLGALLLAGYPLLGVRVARYYERVQGWPPANARLYAAAMVVSRFSQAQGFLRYWTGRLGRRPSRIIEYKGAGSASAGAQTVSPA